MLAHHIRPGTLALDATCGNGHDTVFLAHAVGPDGRVIACDIQPQAIEKTLARLTEAGLTNRVQCMLANHARMDDWLPPSWKNGLGVVMFNLGYLPGGDKTIITQPSSSLAAIQKAWENLLPEGCLSILLYRGHPGGAEEAEGILNWAEQSIPEEKSECWDSPFPTAASPLWLFIRK